MVAEACLGIWVFRLRFLLRSDENPLEGVSWLRSVEVDLTTEVRLRGRLASSSVSVPSASSLSLLLLSEGDTLPNKDLIEAVLTRELELLRGKLRVDPLLENRFIS